MSKQTEQQQGVEVILPCPVRRRMLKIRPATPHSWAEQAEPQLFIGLWRNFLDEQQRQFLKMGQ